MQVIPEGAGPVNPAIRVSGGVRGGGARAAPGPGSRLVDRPAVGAVGHPFAARGGMVRCDRAFAVARSIRGAITPSRFGRGS